MDRLNPKDFVFEEVPKPKAPITTEYDSNARFTEEQKNNILQLNAYLALDLTLYIANGEMTVALPSLDLGVKAQGITYQELFSEFGDLLDEIAGDPDGLQRKRMNE